MDKTHDRNANRHLMAMFAHSVSQGAYDMMLDSFCNANALGTHQWFWHGTTLFDMTSGE